MPIAHTTYTAKIELAVPCLVHCKNCDCRFVYERQFSGAGRADTLWSGSDDRTRQTAEAQARDDLVEMLSHIDIYDPVPCPQCFHYQPYMFAQVGYGRYDNLGCVCYPLIVLGVLLVVGAIGYAVLGSAATVAYVLATSGVVSWLVGWALLQRLHRLVKAYDPNEERPLDERKHIAGARAIVLADYDARQARRVSEAYRARGPDHGDREGFVTEWWLPSAVFLNGGIFTVAFSDSELFTVRVSDEAEQGDVVDARPTNPRTGPFRLRLLEMRVHPEEMRLD
ncbi:MAG: hypothetical protein FJ304_06845 [Planctomycetes bacterium]|nr:hypothetical protein [Planctomycetota bacterium]